MAKYIVKFEFRDGSSWRDKQVAYVNMIVEAPNEQIAKAVALNCAAYKKVARLHKRLWSRTKGEVRLFILERKSRWNNMSK